MKFEINIEKGKIVNYSELKPDGKKNLEVHDIIRHLTSWMYKEMRGRKAKKKKSKPPVAS